MRVGVAPLIIPWRPYLYVYPPGIGLKARALSLEALALAGRRWIYNRLDAPDFAVVQHHFDAVRVCGTFGEDAGHDALRQYAGALVLLLHDLHAQPRANCTAYRYT